MPKGIFRKLTIVLCAVIALWAKDSVVFGQLKSDSPEVQRAISRGVNYLIQTNGGPGVGRRSLGAYALLKSGQPASHRVVAGTVDQILAKIQSNTYRPQQHHIYEAGIELMTLEAADPVKYYPEISAIANFIIANQGPNGQWDYAGNTSGGDTSISQYALLGLWAAARAGVEVPTKVWDQAAAWHLSTQRQDGGFAYHPGSANKTATHSMTAAGTGSLYVCRLFLFPKARELNQAVQELSEGQAAEKKLPRFRYRVLERIDYDDTPIESESSDDGPYRRRVKLQELDQRIRLGLEWMTRNFEVRNPTGWPIYYMYGLERLGALSNLSKFGNRNWYEEGAQNLLGIQAANGSWSGRSGASATCFALLFLGQTTSKLLDRPAPEAVLVGSGLLAGGRGLPEDLSTVQSKDGEVKARKKYGPLDELLKQLANPTSTDIEFTQEAVVETIQLGDRKELIGQTKLLSSLVDDKRVEVRRTALWALGRSEDLRVAPLLIEALNDPDMSVMVEAHNALCVLSRKPDGLGIPADPLKNVEETAGVTEKQDAIQAWQERARDSWQQWYEKFQPYEQRDRLRVE